MKTGRHILVLYDGDGEPALVRQLAEAVARLGSTAAVLRMCSGRYEEILDAVAVADTVIYWPPGDEQV